MMLKRCNDKNSDSVRALCISKHLADIAMHSHSATNHRRGVEKHIHIRIKNSTLVHCYIFQEEAVAPLCLGATIEWVGSSPSMGWLESSSKIFKKCLNIFNFFLVSTIILW